MYIASITALKDHSIAVLGSLSFTHKSDLLMQMKRYMTVNVYSSFRPALSRKQKGRLLRS